MMNSRTLNLVICTGGCRTYTNYRAILLRSASQRLCSIFLVFDFETCANISIALALHIDSMRRRTIISYSCVSMWIELLMGTAQSGMPTQTADFVYWQC